MGIFGTIASAADAVRVLKPGASALFDAAARLALPDAAPADTAAPAPTTPASPSLRPLTGALGAQSGIIAARQGAADVRQATLQDIGALFSASQPNSDLRGSFDAFTRAWQTLAADPGNPTTQQEVIDRGSTLAATVRTLSQGVDDVASRLGDSVAAGIADLNQTLAEIHQANRSIVGQAALGRPTDQAEAARDQRVAHVVDLTGASVFPRENKAVALYTANGQALLDQRPTTFTSAAAKPSGTADTATTGRNTAPNAVSADGRIVDGRLGALLRLAADGSKQNPPQRVDPDPGAEVVRKLRSQLDAVTNTVLGRSRPNQPTSFADAYDSAPAKPGQLVHGFFTGGNRLALKVNPALTDETLSLKPTAAPTVAASLTADRRQLSADGLALPGSNYRTLVATVSGTWQQTSTLAVREAKVADAATSLMTDRRQGSGAVDLQTEVSKLQTLETAKGSTQQVGHALGAFMAVLGQLTA